MIHLVFHTSNRFSKPQELVSSYFHLIFLTSNRFRIRGLRPGLRLARGGAGEQEVQHARREPLATLEAGAREEADAA